MNSIQKCTELHFNPDKLAVDICNLVLGDVNFSHLTYKEIDQIAFHATRDWHWFEGTGSLYDYTQNEFTHHTSEFNKTNPILDGSYLGDAIELVRRYAKEKDGVNIGRIRLMRLKPKTCYTLHQDPEEFRYHIPIFTNPKAFFVVADEIGRMPAAGSLYKFRTNAQHTAVNASFHERIHIVFDTYKDEE